MNKEERAERNAAICGAYLAGWARVAIAEEWGITPQAVSHVLRNAGACTRPRGQRKSGGKAKANV